MRTTPPYGANWWTCTTSTARTACTGFQRRRPYPWIDSNHPDLNREAAKPAKRYKESFAGFAASRFTFLIILGGLGGSHVLAVHMDVAITMCYGHPHEKPDNGLAYEAQRHPMVRAPGEV